MKILVVVPMYNYSEGVARLVEWFSSSPLLHKQPNPPGETESSDLLIFDDGSEDHHHQKIVKVIEDLKPTDLHRIPVQRKIRSLCVPPGQKLRYVYRRAAELAKEWGNYDAILTCESDCIPNDDTLESMIWVFENNRSMFDGKFITRPDNIPLGGVVSVSPFYTWNGQKCYPCQPTWFYPSDNPDCHQVLNSQHGRVGVTRAVPFLFTLWRPDALLQIDKTMPVLYHLDTKLGNKLWDSGFVHLRLLEHSVEHEGGGHRSRS